MSTFIKTSNGETIDLSGCRARVESTTLFVQRTDGTETAYRYADNASALADLANISAIIGAQSVGDPVIESISPDIIAHASLPHSITILGANFDATAAIQLVTYDTPSTSLVVVFNDSGSLTATVPNTVVIAVYDIIYTDSNGKNFLFQNGLVID